MSHYNDCVSVTPECPVEYSTYGYAPSLAANAFFIAFFALTGLIHLYMAIKWKTIGFGIAMFWGHLSLIIGYIGRIMMHYNAWSLNGFMVQICCLTIAPAFLAAGIYLCLSRIVISFGEKISRIPARFYTYIFVACDFVSLVLQGSGGGVASTAAQNGTNVSLGNNLMMAGLAFQVATLGIFFIFASDYAIRVIRRRDQMDETHAALRNTFKFKGFLFALTLAFTTVFIRCVYRVIELHSGWGSELMKKESEFIVCEGVMICIAVLILIIFHPGYCFKEGFVPGLKKRKPSGSETSAEKAEADV